MRLVRDVAKASDRSGGGIGLQHHVAELIGLRQPALNLDRQFERRAYDDPLVELNFVGRLHEPFADIRQANANRSSLR